MEPKRDSSVQWTVWMTGSGLASAIIVYLVVEPLRAIRRDRLPTPG
jgi:hypothetical protein